VSIARYSDCISDQSNCHFLILTATVEVTPKSPESRELRRLAALQRGELPPAVRADKELMAKLPALFRTLEGDPVDERLLDDLIDTIRRE
jgi:hypothetical protein